MPNPLVHSVAHPGVTTFGLPVVNFSSAPLAALAYKRPRVAIRLSSYNPTSGVKTAHALPQLV